MLDNSQILAIIIAVLIIAIFYFLFAEKFALYTSGASQRYLSEFTSTNQDSSVMEDLALGNDITESNDPLMPDYLKVDNNEHFVARRDEVVNLNEMRDFHRNHNRYAGVKQKVFHNSPKSESLERELFAKKMEDNFIPFNL